MTDPITTLIELNHESLHLDMIQSWIDGAREAAPTNQRVQLELDRQQASVDNKRFMIGAIMASIRNNN